MDEDEGGEYCLPGYLKERLIRSYESEADFYKDKLDREGDNVDVRLKIEMENRIVEAEANIQNVKDMVVCNDLEADVETPAESEVSEQPTSDLDPLSADDS